MKNIIVKELKKVISQPTWEFLKAHKAMLVGGALTSILTKKEINDFDIYFKDRDSFILSLMDVRCLKDNLCGSEFPDLDIYDQYLDQYEFQYLCHTEKSVTFKPKYSEVLFQFIHQNFYKDVSEVFNDACNMTEEEENIVKSVLKNNTPFNVVPDLQVVDPVIEKEQQTHLDANFVGMQGNPCFYYRSYILKQWFYWNEDYEWSKCDFYYGYINDMLPVSFGIVLGESN